MTKMIAFADTLLSDMYKDAYGFRPRNYPEFMTEDEVNAEYDHLEHVINCELLLEQQRELCAQRELEGRLARYMYEWDVNRSTALRWEWEGDGEERDLGYWAYQMGISYYLVPMYLDELRNAGVADLYTT